MGSCCSSEKKSGEQPMPPARHAHPTLPSTNIVRTAGGPGRTLGGSVNNDNNNINRSSGSINSRNGSVNTRSSLLYSTPGRRLSSSSNLVVGERLDARSAAALAATVSLFPSYTRNFPNFKSFIFTHRSLYSFGPSMRRLIECTRIICVFEVSYHYILRILFC